MRVGRVRGTLPLDRPTGDPVRGPQIRGCHVLVLPLHPVEAAARAGRNVSRRVIISGGSIGGLFAAAALIRAGWHVDVFERTGVELSGRGAGIVTHAALVAALQAVGASTKDLGVEVSDRIAFDLQGAPVQTLSYPQIVTSWDCIHQILREKIPDARHLLGQTITGYRQHADQVEVAFADGSTRSADLLVGADGFRSAVRAQMLPETVPEYAGYVVWRTLAQERDLPPAVHENLFGAFGFFLPSGSQIIGYPIAGPGNDLRPGHRRYNFVWYTPLAAAGLQDMLTDANGTRHPMSIPPPLVRDDVLARMLTEAAAVLPRSFVELLAVSERPFFTPIYDHLSPVMATGRVALAGDAACVARPHVGMGVTKAAGDALALARHLDAQPVTEALASYSAERVPAARLAYERARLLGRWIFAEPATGQNADGRSHPHRDQIMRLTAVVPDPL